MRLQKIFYSKVCCLVLFFFICSANPSLWAQTVTLNVLAVNGTDKPKEKDIEEHLPPELSQEDILETDGLELDYDVTAGSYVVRGTVKLEPKESRTFRLRFKDVWLISPDDVKEIKNQIDLSLQRIQGTEFEKVGTQRKDSLLKRLNYILQEQERNSDNADRRISSYRSYADEFRQIREKAVSVSYWKTLPPKATENGTVSLILQLENPTDNTVTISPRHYLPAEVKPEHLVNYEGFELRYDPIQKKLYLIKEETLKPAEKKNYTISVVDIWRIPPQDIENLRERSRNAYSFLEQTVYGESALYLIRNIKDKLDRVDQSQDQEREIKEHISAFRVNTLDFQSAREDVEALEDLLLALREELERSKLRNVLQRIKQFRSLADVAEAVFGTKPEETNAWRIIIGIVIFVGFLTFIHFLIWGKRSQEAKLKLAGKGKDGAE